MPHGDGSDLCALVLVSLGITHMAAPAFLLTSVGPLQPAVAAAPTPVLEAVLGQLGFVGRLPWSCFAQARVPAVVGAVSWEWFWWCAGAIGVRSLGTDAVMLASLG
jgi:hypothetical protein